MDRTIPRRNYPQKKLSQEETIPGRNYPRKKLAQEETSPGRNSTKKEQHMEVQLRKHLYNLTISGKALLVFTAWALLKGFLVVFLDAPAITETSDDLAGTLDQLEDAAAEDPLLAVAVLGTILLILILYVVINVYIGKSAIAVGKKKKKGKIFYLVLTVILLSGNLIMDIFQIITYDYTDFSLASVATIILEATSLYIFFEVLYSSIRIRRLQQAGISADGLDINPPADRNSP